MPGHGVTVGIGLADGRAEHMAVVDIALPVEDIVHSNGDRLLWQLAG